MTVLIYIAVTVLAIKYRRQPGQDAHQIEGSTILELTWSIIPFFVMLTFFIWGAVIYFKERTPPADATEVYVVAKQWMWKIEHMEGQREINELHVPMGQNVKLIMTSQDVIHSFFVPAFRIKQDVLPGRYTTLWFKATVPGRYHLFCAEYCGTMHSGMGGDIVVMEPQDYAQWMAGGPAAPLQETGKQLFAMLGCTTCHRSDIQGRGPNLEGVYNKPVLSAAERIAMIFFPIGSVTRSSSTGSFSSSGTEFRPRSTGRNTPLCINGSSAVYALAVPSTSLRSTANRESVVLV